MKKVYRTILALSLIVASTLSIGYATAQVAYADGVNLDTPPNQTEEYTGSLEKNPIIEWIQFFVNLLAVVIIVGSVVMAAFAGLQYTAARDNAQGVQAAKEKLGNIAFGLVAFFFLYGFVQWLIPGGVF